MNNIVPEDIKVPPLENNVSVTTLHYALAAEVDNIRDRITEIKADIARLSAPKPFQWGIITATLSIVLTFIVSIGGLVVENMAARIENLEKINAYFNATNVDALKTANDTHNKKEDVIETRIMSHIGEIESKVLPLFETRTEFQATIDAIHQRQERNERYIDQNKEQLTTYTPLSASIATNNRIDQLYILYKELQNQQFQLLSQTKK
jgi:hypothetical protein